MKKYVEIIDNGFINESELDMFIDTIANDENLSDRKYEYLRHMAIERFYEV